MIRLFVALDLPDDVADRLLDMQTGVPGARWVPRDNMHLTLAFIGEVDEDRAQDIDDMLSAIHTRPFSFSLVGVGSFGRREPTSLWAGVETPHDALSHLHEKVMTALRRVNVRPVERKFLPHVTLARLKGAPFDHVQDFLRTHGDFRSPPVPVGAFHLYSSHLSHNGTIYTPERTYVM
jgi:2'-5' RNA ligase